MTSGLTPSRVGNIALRTAHIGATGILLGGHFFGVAAARLLPLLYTAILTGAGLAFVEFYPDWRGLFELRAFVIAAKLLLLCLIPWLWGYRVGILMLVLVVASAGSHMPRRFRHHSVLEHRQLEAMRDSRTAT